MQSTSPEVKNKLISQIFEVLISEGIEGFKPIMEWLLNETMKVERQVALKADPYERNPERTGYANGFKSRTFASRMGELKVQMPQVRGIKFYPKSLERGCRSEVALKLAIAEMYVKGVSTRKVTDITEMLCGLEISSGQVSQIAKGLDEELEKFRTRPLGEYPFVIMDARYEKVRYGGHVRDCAVLIAIGINPEGRREILGVSVSLSEAEVHWKKFFEGLQQRGLRGMQLITSDDHSGLRAARRAVFPSVPWQRCQFHLAQNAQSYAPTQAMKPELGQVIRDIFNATSLFEAQARKQEAMKQYQKKAPDFVKWLDENIEEGFTVFQFPRPYWKRLRTSNALENVNREIKRRTRIATIFPNTESCLRLVTALVQEIHEEWIGGTRYLNMNLIQGDHLTRIYRKKVA